jgi:hypothetical protein
VALAAIYLVLNFCYLVPRKSKELKLKNFILENCIIDPEQLAVDALNTSDLAKQMPNVSEIIR